MFYAIAEGMTTCLPGTVSFGANDVSFPREGKPVGLFGSNSPGSCGISFLSGVIAGGTISGTGTEGGKIIPDSGNFIPRRGITA